MRAKLKTLWQTGGALQRLAQIRFKEVSLNHRIGRTHQALLGPEGAVTLAQKRYEELIRQFGEETQVEIEGRLVKQWIVPAGGEKERQFQVEWNRIVEPEEEFWGVKIPIEQLEPYLSQITAADIGALSTWLIQEPEGE